MSTILEVLRKAQEEGRPKSGVGEVPGGLLDGARSKRQRWAWTAVVAVLAVGFVGGWWIGSRPRSEAPGPEVQEEASGEQLATIEPEVERAAEPPAAVPAERPPALPAEGPAAEPGGSARQSPPQADANAATKPAARPDASNREVVRAAPLTVDAAPPRAVGERRPPPYVEQQPGPSGSGPPRLRAIPRPGARAEGGIGGSPPAAEPAGPAGNAVALAPTQPSTSGSFRDADEVRLEAEAPPSAGRDSPSERRSRGSAATDRGPIAEAEPSPPSQAEPAAVPGAGRTARERPRIAPETEEAPRLASLPPAAGGGGAADPDAELLARAVRRAPNGAPDVTINIVQWSATPTRRFAYVRVDGSQMMQVREGDEIGGLTVKRIFQQAVEFAHGGSSFVLRAN